MSKRAFFSFFVMRSYRNLQIVSDLEERRAIVSDSERVSGLLEFIEFTSECLSLNVRDSIIVLHQRLVSPNSQGRQREDREYSCQIENNIKYGNLIKENEENFRNKLLNRGVYLLQILDTYFLVIRWHIVQIKSFI
jgi:hypothetical protein